jgi:sulfoxide reductase heme-binding subunit YedZ
VTRIPPGKAILWLLLALPALAMALGWLREADPWLPDYVAASGLWSARLLIVALCLTPLQRLLRHRPWLAWAIRHRRAVGVAAFCYALLHLALYAADMAGLDAIAGESAIPSMAAGWLAFAAMFVPALISSDRAMRALGAGWKRLQRFAYPAAVLTLIHWMLVHDGFSEALLHVAPLLILQALRLSGGASPWFTTERKTT